MIEPVVKMTYNGGPLDKLNELIEKRQKWLGETYKDAIVATAITALKSIRASTRLSRAKVKVEQGGGNGVSFMREDSLRPHWRRIKGAKCAIRCLRKGENGPVFVDGRIVQLVAPGEKAWTAASVYVVSISSERLARWPKQPASFYVVASSPKAVESYLSKRYSKVAERSSGMAKHVLGLAMAEISTRPPKKPAKLGKTAAKRAKDFMRVMVSSGDNTYRVRVESNLSYAMSAVRGGAAGVNDALKRAANSVAGMIRKRVGERLTENLSTPFQEVKRK